MSVLDGNVISNKELPVQCENDLFCFHAFVNNWIITETKNLDIVQTFSYDRHLVLVNLPFDSSKFRFRVKNDIFTSKGCGCPLTCLTCVVALYGVTLWCNSLVALILFKQLRVTLVHMWRWDE